MSSNPVLANVPPDPRSCAVPAPLRAAGRRLRPLQPADLDVVLEIEAAAYSHPWTRGNFADALAHGALAGCLEQNHRVLGYFVAQPGVEELHLLNLTVATRWRRQGLGRALLMRVRHWAACRGDAALWLEVRAGNHAALALYRAEGFVEVGRRRGYYPSAQGREDAVVMRGAPVQGSDLVST